MHKVSNIIYYILNIVTYEMKFGTKVMGVGSLGIRYLALTLSTTNDIVIIVIIVIS